MAASGYLERLSWQRVFRTPPPRLLSHGWVAGLVLLVALGELMGGWSARTNTGPVIGGARPPELVGVGLIPAGSLAAAIPTTQLRSPVRAALAPELSRPVELVDAFRETHLLQPGERLGDVAARYGIPLESLIWVNNLDRGDALAVGQALRIPRVAGVLHTVQGGESLEEIAALHQVPVEAIATFGPNRLSELAPPQPGAQLFVPGATRPLPDTLLRQHGGLSGLALRSGVPVGVVREDQTNLRQGPGRAYLRVLQLGPGRQVELRARHEDWLKVAIGGAEGWVRGDLLSVDPALVGALPETNDFPPPPPQWVWPARGTLTSGFGARWGGFHNGIDIANRAWTPIGAASAGVVREAGWCRGYGYCVRIRHEGGIETIYGHMIDQPVVSAGEEVGAGQLIGYMGSTYDRAGGGYSTGVHLHLTIYVNGRAVDPLRFLP